MSGLGAAVIGTGFGLRAQVPALRAAGFDVVALVGRDPDRTRRRAERAGVPIASVELDAVLARDDVHAVAISTPPDAHGPVTIRAAEAGKHVICEKPFALDAAEARRMLAAARASGVEHLVGHEFRWSEAHALVQRAVADGRIGEPRTASVVAYVPLVARPDAPVPPWWFDPLRGGGWLGASGSHLVDQLRSWFGDIAEVSATLVTVGARSAQAEDTFMARFTTVSGLSGVVHQTAASWTGEVVGLTAVAGTAGTLVLDGNDVVVSTSRGTERLVAPPELALPAPPVGDDPVGRFVAMELGPYTRLCETFRDRILGVPPTSPVSPATFEDGVAVMEVLDAMRRSAARGGEREPVTSA